MGNFDSSGHLELSVKAEWRKKALEKSAQPVIFMTRNPEISSGQGVYPE